MFKLLIKLAIAALIVNALWRLGSAYVTFYRFKDAVSEYALFNPQKPAPELQQRVMDLASQFDVPLSPDAVSIRRDVPNHTYINASYTQVVDLFPGYHHPWEFSWEVDAMTIPGATAPNGR